MGKEKDSARLCKVRLITNEVFYADEPLPELCAADMHEFEEKAARNERRTVRLCTHRTVEDTFHEMFIVHSRATFVPPHKHGNKIESASVIAGRMDIVIFDDAGAITRVVRMGEYGSGLSFYFRLAESVYHTMLIRSHQVIYHEATTGPFRKEDMIIAPFAPAATTRDEQLKYIAELSEKADRWRA